tara:strand:+ start:905 stop:1387 length:483 start_codon:yes stop_codon:yes gene_type:complete
MRINTYNKEFLEKNCDCVNDEEARYITNILMRVCLEPSNSDCVGLAYNQINGTKRVFIAKVGKNGTWKTFINPSVISYNGKKFIHNESCMSFPNKSSDVTRYESVTISHLVLDARKINFKDEEFSSHEYVEETFTGFNACIIQHEIDHLNGIHIFNKGKK